MRTIVAIALSILWTCAAPSNASQITASDHHLRSAKIRYPHSLLGADFGVLNEEDLAANTCDAVPQPFSPASTSFPYWQCFDANSVSFACDSSDVPDEYEGVQGLIVLTATSQGGRHDYVARRPSKMDDCVRFGRTFATMQNGVDHICISGSLIKITVDEHGGKTTSWIFDKYKTRNGCESYFKGDCDLTYQIKHGCKVSKAND